MPEEPKLPTFSSALGRTQEDELKPAAAQPPLEEGIGLCLSGGGFRATLFHLGVLLRLNELGLLRDRIACISSVSGGSITAGYLGLKWKELVWDENGMDPDFYGKVVDPVRQFCYQNVDVKAVVEGGLLPIRDASDVVVAAYRDHLFEGRTLQDLPDRPRFVINATNVQSGALWRFTKRFMGDWRVGTIPQPTVPMAEAVAASSAFPPFLSPLEMKLDPASFTPGTGHDLQRPPFTEKVVLSDGGVYDNLGLEQVLKHHKTLLVSDAGQKIGDEEHPHGDWGQHTVRILGVVDNQVRSLRKRMLVGSFVAKERIGAYWSIRGDIADYPAPKALACSLARTQALAAIATRLKRIETDDQERLINWGYALADAAIRTWIPDLRSASPPTRFIHPIGV